MAGGEEGKLEEACMNHQLQESDPDIPKHISSWQPRGVGVSFPSVSESVEYCVLLSSVKSMKTTYVKVKCGKAGLYGGITVQ